MRKFKYIDHILLVVILILINILGTYYFFRIDLTVDKRYSISNESKQLVSSIEDIIYFKIYLDGELPLEYKKLKNEIIYILDELRVHSKLIEYEFIDPTAIDNEQYRLSLQKELYEKGISPIPHRSYDTNKMEEFFIFPGVIATYQSKENTINIINETLMNNPDLVIRESAEKLEYLFTNSIRTLITQKKQKIGLINGHGEITNNKISSFKELISEHYQLIDISINEKLSSLDEMDCIIINNPSLRFSEKDKFIIDQFIMKGGKSIWILNGTNANMDSLEAQSETLILESNDKNINDLLFKYGVRINTNILQDLQAAPIPVVTNYIDNKPQWNFFPWVFFPVISPNSIEHIINYKINPIKLQFPSSIDTIRNKTKKTILLKTSQYTKVSTTPTLINLESLKNKPNKTQFNSGEKNAAILLSGYFESLFKNRISPIISNNTEINFKDYISDNKMIIISDGYFIENQFFKGQNLPIGFDKHTGTQYGNDYFILNAIDYLLDNHNFIKIRSKNIKLRLLNKAEIENRKKYWQIFNLITPLFLLLIIGTMIFILRERKYKN